MTLTTDPRTVISGRVRVSTTSTVKRDALVGRLACHTIQPEADPSSRRHVHARIINVTGSAPLARIVWAEDQHSREDVIGHNREDVIGHTVILSPVVTLVGSSRELPAEVVGHMPGAVVEEPDGRTRTVRSAMFGASSVTILYTAGPSDVFRRDYPLIIVTPYGEDTRNAP
jgi:hypothetical protein